MNSINKTRKQRTEETKKLVLTSLFIAIIIVLAFTPGLGYIPVGPVKATIIHIPVIIGAIFLGPKRGAFLGFVFGLTSLIQNTINPTPISFVFSPFYSLGDVHGNFKSLIICFIPRILVGVVAYYAYILIRRLLKKVIGNRIIALAIAGVMGSLTNTLLVMNGIYFLYGTTYAEVRAIELNVLYGAILTVITTNGVVEAILAGVLVTAIGKALSLVIKAQEIEQI